jgi:hypothetical protein
MTAKKKDQEEEVTAEKATEAPVIPGKKPAKFTNPPINFSGKGATKFNPPNKQRPMHHAGRGR